MNTPTTPPPSNSAASVPQEPPPLKRPAVHVQPLARLDNAPLIEDNLDGRLAAPNENPDRTVRDIFGEAAEKVAGYADSDIRSETLDLLADMEVAVANTPEGDVRSRTLEMVKNTKE